MNATEEPGGSHVDAVENQMEMIFLRSIDKDRGDRRRVPHLSMWVRARVEK